MLIQKHLPKLLMCLLLLAGLVRPGFALPPGFVFLDEEIPGIRFDLRYSTPNNFMGEVMTGYENARPVLTKPAATALRAVADDLEPFGLTVLVFDAYRPQRAVDHFVRWADDVTDTRMKSEYYPDVDKRNLFKEDYIASRSGHSRGSTVDLTLVSTDTGEPLDMGSAFDFFGQQSWPTYPLLTLEQRANRLLLQTLMVKHGFKPYSKEWWHFTLEEEPFPNEYFDFLPVSDPLLSTSN